MPLLTKTGFPWPMVLAIFVGSRQTLRDIRGCTPKGEPSQAACGNSGMSERERRDLGLCNPHPGRAQIVQDFLLKGHWRGL